MICSSSFPMPSWRTGVNPASICYRGGHAQPTGPATGPLDTSVLSQSGTVNNPFQEVAPGCSTVAVEPWGKSGSNSSLTQILRNQGYSDREIFTPDAHGVTMIDRVASANGLRNPNLIHPGQELRVPSRIPNEESLAPTDGPTPQWPAPQGPTLQGPSPQWPAPQGPTPQWPTLQGPIPPWPSPQGPTAPIRFCPLPRNGSSAEPEGPPTFLEAVGEAVGLSNDVEGAAEELQGPRSRADGPRPPRLLRVVNAGLTVFETAAEINDIRRDSGGRKAERTVETIGRGVGESVGSWLLGTEGMLAGATVGFAVAGPVGLLVGGLVGAVAGGALGKWIGGAVGGGLGRVIGNTPVGRVLGRGVLDTYDRVLGPMERLQESARSLDSRGSTDRPAPATRATIPQWPRLAYT